MIPASLLVVAIPLLFALPAYGLRRARTFESLIGIGACLAVIFILAASEQKIVLPGVVIDIGAPLTLLGREMRVHPPERNALILLFMCALPMFGVTWRARQGWTFTPVGLIVLALFSFALMIRPFVFSALAIVAASAMLAIMIQTESNEDNLSNLPETSPLGAMRYLTLAVLAMPALLAASYLLSRAGNPSTDFETYNRAAAFIAVGFALLLGGFPLFTWIHPVARDAPPLTTAFIASVIIGALAFVVFSLRQEFAWFNNSPLASDIFRGAGVATLIFVALTGWAQKTFSRTLACLVGIGVGVALILLAGNQPLDMESMALGVAAHALSIGLMGLGLALLREQASSDDFESLRGLGAKYPLALLAVGVGGLSAVGLPGTFGFVARWASARAMANAGQLETTLLLVAAIASVGIGLIHGIQVLMDQQTSVTAVESQVVKMAAQPSGRLARYRFLLNNDVRSAILIGVGVVAVILLGIFPGWIGSLAHTIAAGFSYYR